MKIPFCYIVHTGYEEFQILKDISEILPFLKKHYDNPQHWFEEGYIEVQYTDNSKKEFNTKKFIKKVKVTKEEIKQIEFLVDKQIEANEKFMSTLKGTVTGSFGPFKEDREFCIKQEIKNKSYRWKE